MIPHVPAPSSPSFPPSPSRSFLGRGFRRGPWVALVLAAGVAGAADARADVLRLKDGRLVEGAVEKADDAYRVRSRFGESVIPIADVEEWTRAKPLDEQIREHLERLAPEDTENRALLARWMRDVGRDEEARALATAVLELDPENADAHEVLGHIRHQGRWRTPDEAKRAEGLEKHGERWYTPEEWKNLADAERTAAEEAERRAAAEAMRSDVNEAVRLMTSPDPLVRERGRKRLDGIADEHGATRLRELADKVEKYVEARDAVAAASSSGASGSVLTELRITMSRLKRPIQIFETSLASGPLGGSAPVKIQLPELEVIRVRTTVGIPVVVR